MSLLGAVEAMDGMAAMAKQGAVTHPIVGPHAVEKKAAVPSKSPGSITVSA
jgi:hypothetical protein